MGASVIREFEARFPLGEFFRANKQKANVIGWCGNQCLSPANQVAFFSVRANKFAKWKTGLSFEFPVNGERQDVTLAAEVWFNLFVSNFLSFE